MCLRIILCALIYTNSPPCLFSDEILLQSWSHQNLWNSLVSNTIPMLVIHFNHLCRVYWWFMIDINYHKHKVKSRIQGEKCHTLRSRCARVWKKVNWNYTPFVDMISLYNLLFWNMVIFLIFFQCMSLHVLIIFFFCTWTFMCPYFLYTFCIAYVSSSKSYI